MLTKTYGGNKPIMKHYVISYEYAFTARDGQEKLDEVSNGTVIIGVTHTLKSARKLLAKAVSKVRPNISINGWQIQYDSSDAFVAADITNYSNEHVNFYIENVVNKINSSI